MENNMTITNAQYYAPDGRNSSVKATINGLRSVESPQHVSNKRGKSIEHILGIENVKD